MGVAWKLSCANLEEGVAFKEKSRIPGNPKVKLVSRLPDSHFAAPEHTPQAPDRTGPRAAALEPPSTKNPAGHFNQGRSSVGYPSVGISIMEIPNACILWCGAKLNGTDTTACPLATLTFAGNGER